MSEHTKEMLDMFEAARRELCTRSVLGVTAAPSPTDTVSIEPTTGICGGNYVISASDAWANAFGTLKGVGVRRADDFRTQERERILSAIQELKPRQRIKTNGDWARGWREAGELAMWEKIVKAIEEAK